MTAPPVRTSCAIELTFDPATEAAILELRAAVHAVGVAASPRLLDARPHVSLCVIDVERTEPLERVVRGFAISAAPFEIAFDAVGSFAGSNNVLYLAPTPSLDLLRHHRALIDLLRSSDVVGSMWDYYLPDRWVPHCTLELEADEALLPQAFGAVRAALRPLRGSVRGVELVGFPPARILTGFPLRER